MKKAFERLDIYVVGDRLHVCGKIESLCHKRLERDQQTSIEIPDHLRKERHQLRKSRKTVEAGPNAPLLKRMVRNPQSLERGYFTKTAVERLSLESREKIVFPRIVKEELQRDRKIRKIQPMNLHIQPATVTVPSIEEWLRGKNDQSI